ncbi:MAG: adenylate cyclase [Sulfurimonas sp.]|jgi:adenylate cyclase
MKKNHILSILIIFIFITMEFSYINFSSLYKTTDDKITSLFLKSQKEQVASKYITIVDIDAKSIEKLGQWPFPRNLISDAILNLTNSGAGIIGFDIVFSNPDRLSPHKMAQHLKIEGNFTNNDILLASTLQKTPTILGYFFDMSNPNEQSAPKLLANIDIRGSKNLDYFNQAKGVVGNIKELKESAYSSGYFNLTNITSGVVDSAPILIDFEGELYPSLALEMIRIASSQKSIEVLNSDLGVEGVKLGNLNILTNKRAEIKLNFRGKGFSYKYISFYDVLTNNFDESDVNGNFILIGTSDIGLNDMVTTLYDPAIPGVEVHATTIDNILNGDFFYTPINSYTYGIFLIFFSSIVVGLILYYLPASFSLVVFLFSFLLLMFMNYYLIFTKHIILGFSAPLITLFLTTGFFALLSYYFENIQRKKIFSKLSSKVSKSVAQEILKYDENILQVEKKEVTVLFSDIRGFTTLSEDIKDPIKLIEILNRYMSPMVESITEFNGTVDKFIGDAIMAYFNAPLPLENHADMALKSALRQLERLDVLNIELKKEFGIELKIGIGINSGDAIVGEMGSSGRSDYTLIGDTVNVASRVEDLTKVYKCKLIITEQTKDLLQDTYNIKKLDVLRVKGKKEETTIYEVIS